METQVEAARAKVRSLVELEQKLAAAITSKRHGLLAEEMADGKEYRDDDTGVRLTCASSPCDSPFVVFVRWPVSLLRGRRAGPPVRAACSVAAQVASVAWRGGCCSAAVPSAEDGAARNLTRPLFETATVDVAAAYSTDRYVVPVLPLTLAPRSPFRCIRSCRVCSCWPRAVVYIQILIITRATHVYHACVATGAGSSPETDTHVQHRAGRQADVRADGRRERDPHATPTREPHTRPVVHKPRPGGAGRSGGGGAAAAVQRVYVSAAIGGATRHAGHLRLCPLR